MKYLAYITQYKHHMKQKIWLNKQQATWWSSAKVWAQQIWVFTKILYRAENKIQFEKVGHETWVYNKTSLDQMSSLTTRGVQRSGDARPNGLIVCPPTKFYWGLWETRAFEIHSNYSLQKISFEKLIPRSILVALQYEEASSIHNYNFCNFALWIAPALDTQSYCPVCLPPLHAPANNPVDPYLDCCPIELS